MDYLFLVLLFVVAFVYSSVGHGGSSGYLALMAVFGISVVYMKASALTLNIFVSGVSLFSFSKAGYFRWKIILPFIITSIPMAFIGAKIHVEPGVYKIILGIFLIIITARMLFINPKENKHSEIPVLPGLFIGAFLGFFSGMIGIGGGIILSPVIILLGWANIKEAAAVSALFILVNSVSGLTGVLFSNAEFSPKIILWVIIAFSGGLLGAYLGSKILNPKALKYILSGVLLMAGTKLLFF